MRVTGKLMACIFSVTTGIALASAWIALRMEENAFRREAEQEAESIANTLESSIAQRWQEAGLEGVMRRIRLGPTHYDLQMKWVWFDEVTDTRFQPGVGERSLPQLVPRRAVSVRVEDHRGARLHTYWPMSLDDRMGGLEFTQSTEELARRQNATLWRTAGVIGTTLLLGGVVMWWSGVLFVGRPLRLLTDKAKRVGEGDLDGDLTLERADEMGELAQSLNQMCAQLREAQERIVAESAQKLAAIEQLQHADRLRTVGRLASGIAHELGTPLNVVSGRAEMLARGDLSPEEVHGSAEAIRHESQRMTALIQSLLDFARRQPPNKHPVNVHQLLEATCQLLTPMAQKHKVRFDLQESTAPCQVAADTNELQQVFTNLLVNAIQAMPDGGVVHLQLTRDILASHAASLSTGEFICVRVGDEGPGIPAEDLDQVFEPFFTTKEPGEGTGLGLSIAQRIVTEHGGQLQVASEPGVGTTFFVYLPCGDCE